MRVLITGATGMLGKKIFDRFNKEGFTTFGVARNKNLAFNENEIVLGDITNFQFVNSLKAFEPDVVIHTAANVDVNDCEKDKDKAKLLHIESSKNLSKVFCNSMFFYISTDSVFSGDEGMFDEECITNPLNYYAETKLMGEKAILDNNNKAYIVRLNLYGYHLPFRNSLFEWCISNLENNVQIKGFRNVFFNPLYTEQIASALIQIIRKEIPYGIYNLASNGFLSKYEFLLQIAEKFGFDKNLIEPIDAVTNSMGVQRPNITTLLNTKIKTLLPEIDFSFNFGLEHIYQDYSQTKNNEKN